MVKRGLLQILIFIYNTVKSAVEVWINGDVNVYICRGSILKRPTYFFPSSYLATTPTPPLPVSYPCWHTSRCFTSLLVLLLSVWQVQYSLRGVGGGLFGYRNCSCTMHYYAVMHPAPAWPPDLLPNCTPGQATSSERRPGYSRVLTCPALFKSYRLVEILQQL
jgi:hypothetical protein